MKIRKPKGSKSVSLHTQRVMQAVDMMKMNNELSHPSHNLADPISDKSRQSTCRSSYK